MNISEVTYRKWKKCVKLSAGDTELVITRSVGPRIIRYGFAGGPNLFGEIRSQAGGKNENEWMIRGGHRLWIAPEGKPRSYELDNVPVKIEEIANGVKTIQEPGTVTGVQKSMEITVDPDTNRIKINHILTNRGEEPFTLSVWALTVMGLRGMAVIPLPPKKSHDESLVYNQEWSLWGYTDLSDPRWTIGKKYLLFRQDPKRAANKIGMTQREGWVAYHLKNNVFIKRFTRDNGRDYPDGNVNFETFANEEILELESLGCLTTLQSGESAAHEEVWSLHRDVAKCRNEAEIDERILPLV